MRASKTSYRESRQPLERSRGFTLVELLVVIAIIAVLLGLLLPAVQMTREAGRRAACLGNLKQIGTALASYHTTWSTFPVGCVEWRASAKLPRKQLAWSAFILPQLDERPLYERLDLREAFDSPRNAEPGATVLDIYLCPSTSRDSLLINGLAACDYGGIYGERLNGPNSPPKGTMIYERSVKDIMIRDGLSNTLIVGEVGVFSDGQWLNGRNVFEQAYPINQAPSFDNELRSMHPAGVNVLYCDTSTRTITDSIDRRVLGAICTRAGGEAVSY
ncbi:MAG: DUF1559 domain-containing protein [Pirellulales bacterium]